jgi:hypothetical protein
VDSLLEEASVDRDGDMFVKADLGNGQVVQVAVQTTTGDPETDVSILDALRRRDQPFPFDGVTSSIEAIAKKVTAALASAKPEKATVEFGIDIGVETGGLTGLLAKGTGTATLKITLEWSGDSSEQNK